MLKLTSESTFHAEVLAGHVHEALREQPREHEQHHRERDLRRRQHAAKARGAATADDRDACTFITCAGLASLTRHAGARPNTNTVNERHARREQQRRGAEPARAA